MPTSSWAADPGGGPPTSSGHGRGATSVFAEAVPAEPVLVVSVGEEGGPGNLPCAVSLVLASLTEDAQDGLEAALGELVERTSLRTSLLGVDLEDGEPADALRLWLHGSAATVHAAAEFVKSSWATADRHMTVKLAASCPEGATCIRARAQGAESGLARRAHLLAWPVAFARIEPRVGGSCPRDESVILAVSGADFHRLDTPREQRLRALAGDAVRHGLTEPLLVALSQARQACRPPFPVQEDECVLVSRLGSRPRGKP